MFQEEKEDCHVGDIVIARVDTAVRVGAALRAWTVSRNSVRLTAPTLTCPLQIPDVDVTDIEEWWEDGCTHIKNA